MAQLLGLTTLKATMEKLKTKYGDRSKDAVVVGFTQRYALHVHENLEAKHPVGQAKYLEQPARELSSSGELGRLVETAVKVGHPLRLALAVAGLRLQRDAQLLVPVDTSALKASAFTTFEEDLESESASKFAESEQIHMANERAAGKYATKKGISHGKAKVVLSQRRHAARARSAAKKAARKAGGNT